MEQGFSIIDFEQSIDELSIEARKRFYTYVAVSYASLEEIRPLLASAKEYAYMYHDKDVDTDGNPRGNHYHIMLAYDQQQTYRKLLKLVKSDKNTFIQGLKRCVGNMLDYFTHDTAKSKHKHQYDPNDIIYSDEEYWNKRLGWQSAEDKNENILNTNFVEDLLSSDYDEVTLARKYGRDFIKNKDRYRAFRMEHLNDDLDELANESNKINAKKVPYLELDIKYLQQRLVDLEADAKQHEDIRYGLQCDVDRLIKKTKSQHEEIVHLNNYIYKLEEENNAFLKIIKEIGK